MIVLGFKPDEAQRILTGVQTVATYPDCYVPAVVVTVADLSELVGQTVAVARLLEVTRWSMARTDCEYEPGAIVGSVTVESVVQIVTEYDDNDRPTAAGDADLTPGRWALIFTDPAPCEHNCLVCLTRGWVGAHNRHGDPIPYAIDGPIGEWTP